MVFRVESNEIIRLLSQLYEKTYKSNQSSAALLKCKCKTSVSGVVFLNKPK